MPPPSESNSKAYETVTVLFVPQTPNGALAANLRKAEQDLSQLCKNKVKIVERSGVGIKKVLVKISPLPEQHCGRSNCLLCLSDKEHGTCKTRNVTYQSRCLTCQAEGLDRQYIGESSRSGYERGLEHLLDCTKHSQDSHMWKHISTEHPNLAEPKFAMKILKAHKTPLNRQVHEAVMIMLNESTTLNSRGEFNRCQLPRLTVMMGEREDRPYEKNDQPDDFFEDEIDVNSNQNQSKSKRKDHPTTTITRRKRAKITPEVQQ